MKLTKRHLRAAIDAVDLLRSMGDTPIDWEEIRPSQKYDCSMMEAHFTVEFSASPFDLPGRIWGYVALSENRDRIYLSAAVSIHLSSGPQTVPRCHLNGEYDPEANTWALRWTT